MKNKIAFSLLAAFLLTSVAQAERIYTCTVKSESVNPNGKNYPGTKEERRFLLSAKRLSLVGFNSHRTILELKIDADGNLEGYVNKQRNFILEGNIRSTMKFRSTDAQGEIECDEGLKANVVYVGLVPGMLSGNLKLKPMQGGVCYAGDVEQAKVDLEKAFQPSPIKTYLDSENTIKVVASEKACLRGRGTNVDDYECEEYGVVSRTYQIRDCDYRAPERP